MHSIALHHLANAAAEAKQLMRPETYEDGDLEEKEDAPPRRRTQSSSAAHSKPQPPPTRLSYPTDDVLASPRSGGKVEQGCGAAWKRGKQQIATFLCCQQQAYEQILDPNRAEAAPPPRTLRDFSMGRELGAGSSASVYEGIDTEFGVRVALKLVGIKSRKAPQAFSSVSVAYANEKSALEAVAHPNVLRLHSASDREHYHGRRTSLLVLERCPNGELYNVMEKLKALDERVVRTYAHQLFSGLAACHAELVYHRDIKPENILLAEDWSIRIADFGLSNVGREGMARDTCGTTGYMAPEVFCPPTSGHDPARADVWAATVVTFILAMGNPPITKACPKCWFYRQIRDNRWGAFWKAHEKFGPVLSDDLKELIQRGLNPVMLARPSVRSMLDSPLFDLPRLSAGELREHMEEMMAPHSPAIDLDSSYEGEDGR